MQKQNVYVCNNNTSNIVSRHSETTYMYILEHPIKTVLLQLINPNDILMNVCMHVLSKGTQNVHLRWIVNVDCLKACAFFFNVYLFHTLTQYPL